MTWHLPSVALLTLLCAAACALPQLPEGMDPAEYYGGFYPTEEWVRRLEPLPREQRSGPFQRVEVVEEQSEGREAWSGAVIRLTRDELAAMRRRMAPYLAVEPEDLLGLVPRRNRLAGNARVMPGHASPPCPTGDGGRLQWTPDRPDEIRCTEGHAVDPFELFPPTGVFEITGPLGEMQRYPYHDAPDGRRTFVQAEFMDTLRVHELSRAARELGILYAVDGDEAAARRAAAIIYDFAGAVPHWPKIHRGRPNVEGIERFRPVDEITVYAGIWYDKYHTGTNRAPKQLALGYDLVAGADVWRELDADAAGGDARETIERDLFLYTARDAIRYDIRYPEAYAALSNYIPYQIAGLTAIGRAAGMPELVHYGAWKARQLAEKTLMADGIFPESPSYARQHIYGLAKALLLSVGHTDPPGFVSTIDGERFEDLDMARDMPHLGRAIATLEGMVYPDGSYIMMHDTWSTLVTKGHPAPAETTPLIYPSFGHAALARGHRDRGNQIQAHLHYSGSWGHDHRDMLNLILWAYEGELVSDIGYAHTYRMFSDWSLGHNLVVVDRRYQERCEDHGTLVGWHPAAQGLQVVEARSQRVYPQCPVYRRALLVVPLGEDDNAVVDIFTVEGGDTHEWMAQGSAMIDQRLELSAPTAHLAESYADDGQPFEPPAYNEYAKQRVEQGLPQWLLAEGEPDPWYGVFRDVHRGRMEAPMRASFIADGGALPPLHLHMLQPREADVYTCTVPSLRRCWSEAAGGEDHSLVEQFRMPKLIVRRDGAYLRSRFVAVWEPTHAERALAEVADLAPDRADAVAVGLRSAGQPEIEAEVYYCPQPGEPVQVRQGVWLDGRYAAVMRSGEVTDVYLYDCNSFRMPGLDVEVASRPPLPLVNVMRGEDGSFALELDGVWEEAGEGVELAASEQALVRVGTGQRVCPVSGVEAVGQRTLLRCPRHPGFSYDAQAGVLTDEFSPWLQYEGRATVAVGSRVHLRSGDGGWEVVSRS
ncbi:MAG: heparinase II/III family protein [Armatimonadota bacterium]|nr:heparinase II/III family protein [Armatimonadota bacterium]